MFNANQSFLVWNILKCWYILTAGHYHDIFKIGNITQIHGVGVGRKLVGGIRAWIWA